MVKKISLCTSLSLGKPSYLSKDRGPLLGQGILSSNGPIWAHQRKIIAPELYIDKVKVNLTYKVIICNVILWKDIIWNHSFITFFVFFFLFFFCFCFFFCFFKLTNLKQVLSFLFFWNSPILTILVCHFGQCSATIPKHNIVSASQLFEWRLRFNVVTSLSHHIKL